MRLGFLVLLAMLGGALALVAACKDGVTPDCTTDPTVCSPIYGDAAPPDTTVDSGSDAAPASDAVDDDVADAADASG